MCPKHEMGVGQYAPQESAGLMGTREIGLQLPLSSTQTREASLRKRKAH